MKKVPLFVAVAATSLVTLLAPLALAATTVTVSGENMSAVGWNWTDNDRAGGSYDFTNDYDAPDGLGVSSLSLTTLDGSSKSTFFKQAQDGRKLSDLNDLQYWTYKPASEAADPNQVAALNVVIDYNGPAVANGFTTLVFEPTYQTTQDLTTDTWQKWDAGNASIWWSSQPIPGAATRDDFVTLQSIKDANPDAVVQYYGFNQGSGNPSLTSAVDGLRIYDTTFNFEAPQLVTAKDQCMKNGWSNRATADGSTFKNQGQCVSYVNAVDRLKTTTSDAQ